MSVTSFSLVYHNGIMSLHFMNCNLSLFISCVPQSPVIQYNSYAIMPSEGRSEHEGRWEFVMTTAGGTDAYRMGIWKVIQLENKQKRCICLRFHIHTTFRQNICVIQRTYISQDNMDYDSGIYPQCAAKTLCILLYLF